MGKIFENLSGEQLGRQVCWVYSKAHTLPIFFFVLLTLGLTSARAIPGAVSYKGINSVSIRLNRRVSQELCCEQQYYIGYKYFTVVLSVAKRLKFRLQN
jgi:hypothetical protein